MPGSRPFRRLMRSSVILSNGSSMTPIDCAPATAKSTGLRSQIPRADRRRPTLLPNLPSRNLRDSNTVVDPRHLPKDPRPVPNVTQPMRAQDRSNGRSRRMRRRPGLMRSEPFMACGVLIQQAGEALIPRRDVQLLPRARRGSRMRLSVPSVPSLRMSTSKTV